MKKSKITLLSAVALSSLVLAGCEPTSNDNGGGNQGGGKNAKYSYQITMWTGEDTTDITKSMINTFNETNTQSIYIDATLQEVTEKSAAGDVLAKPDSAPEMFCFAQDQIARLVESKLLQVPGKSVVTKLKEEHVETAVAAGTVGQTVYAYPLTADNGYFLYYDKSVITDDEAKSIESIVAKCEANQKYFSFNLSGDGGGWYNAAFFYGTGCKSEWVTDDNGKFTGKEDTYNSDNGVKAMKGIQKVVKSSYYLSQDKAFNFNTATPAAAVVSGVWDYKTAKNALGDKLGIAKLPSFTIGGETFNLKSFLGHKLLGVTPQSDANKAAALSILAQYLTNTENQLIRYKSLGWGPSTKEGQNNEDVKNDPLFKALKESATVPQGQYPASWWTKAQVLGDRAKEAQSDTAIRDALKSYDTDISSLITY